MKVLVTVPSKEPWLAELLAEGQDNVEWVMDGLGWCGSVGASSWTLKDGRFNSQSECAQKATNQCCSFTSMPPPLSKKKSMQMFLNED